MVLDLSLDSDVDGDAGYRAAMASLSLGSSLSLREASPVAPRRQAPLAPRSRKGKAPETSPSSSLDELIDKFRASASSLSHSTRGIQDPEESSTLSRRKPSPRGRVTKAHSRSLPVESLSYPESSDSEVAGVSPMPKLTHVPKQKPTLQTIAPRDNEFSRLKTPVRLDQRYRTVTAPGTHSSSSSSIAENIEPPDSDTTEESLDDLINHDLRKFNSLVASSRDGLGLLSGAQVAKSIDEISDSLQQQTRFRRDSPPRNETVSGRRSSFRLFSSSTSPDDVSLRAGLRVLDKKAQDTSFTEELCAMKRALVQRIEKEKATEAEEKKKQEDEKAKAAINEPGADIASLKDALDAIDKDLLLALRPFERIKQEIATEESKAVETKDKEDRALELPMATQAIVERLEQAFGGLTRQCEAERKEAEDAAAAAKSAEELKRNEEEEKKAIEEAMRRQEELEILKLLPMRGRLLNSEAEVEKALLDLDIADQLARESLASPNSHDVSAQLDALREITLRRTQAIEGTLEGCFESPFCPRSINWHRSTFHINTQDISDDELSVPLENQEEHDSISFGDILQSEVVEKLEFTILKLKHALAIDKKELQEAERERQRAAEVAANEAKKREEEQRRQEEIEANAAAARQRVMGVSSLQEIDWLTAGDPSLTRNNYDEEAARRLEEVFKDVESNGFSWQVPSFTESTRVLKRFDGVKMMMEAPYLYQTFPENQPSPSPRVRSGTPLSISSQSKRPFLAWDGGNNDERIANAESDVVPSRYITRHVHNPKTSQQLSRSSRYRYTFNNTSPARQQVQLPTPHRTMMERAIRSRSKGHQLEEMMATFHQFQRDRRTKATWFYSSQRSV